MIIKTRRKDNRLHRKYTNILHARGVSLINLLLYREAKRTPQVKVVRYNVTKKVPLCGTETFEKCFEEERSYFFGLLYCEYQTIFPSFSWFIS